MLSFQILGTQLQTNVIFPDPGYPITRSWITSYKQYSQANVIFPDYGYPITNNTVSLMLFFQILGTQLQTNVIFPDPGYPITN